MTIPLQATVKAARWRAWAQGLLLAAVSIAFVTGGCSGRPGSGTVTSGAAYVLPPERVHYGASYAEWSARWWQWVFELPRSHHPLKDPTGADALQAQIDPVWFIGGVWGVSGTAERTITIPKDVALFFPIINTVWTAANCGDIPEDTFGFNEMRNRAAATVEAVTDVVCEIDGVRVIDAPTFADAVRWRAQSPEFSTLLPEDNMWNDVCEGLGMQMEGPKVVNWNTSDGIWMMIGPMAPGGHTVHFRGTFPTQDPVFHLDVTYHINVMP